MSCLTVILILTFAPYVAAQERQVEPITRIFSAEDSKARQSGPLPTEFTIYELLGTPETSGLAASDLLDYTLTSRFDHDDGTYLHFNGFEGGIPVSESEVVVVLRKDGTVEGISGTFWPRSSAVELLQHPHSEAILTAEYGRAIESAVVSRLLDPRHGEQAFKVEFEDGRTEILGAQSGEVLYSDPGFTGFQGHGTIDIRVGQFSSLDPDSPIGTRLATQSAGYDTEWLNPNSLIWKLGWLPSGSSHRLEQTWSECCSETTVTEPLGTRPEFGSSSGTKYAQQSAYYWVKTTRDWLVAHPWSAHAPESQANVRVNTDDDAPCFTDDDGCYYPSWNSVYIKAGPLATSFWVPSHEYGHYFALTYGPLDNTCTHQVNEGRAINEAVADAVSWLAVLTSSAIGGTYRSELDPLTRSLPRRQHYDTVFSYSNRCGTSAYNQGDPFRQALWEIMNNLDCQNMTVCTTTTTFGNDIWQSGESRSTVNARVASALAKALKSTPSSTNFSSVVSWILADISSTSGSAVSARAASVFAHHGH